MKSLSPHMRTPLSVGSSARLWRIGLLSVAIFMGLLLVFLGIFEYRDARRNGYRITEAQVLYMMLGFQRQLHQQRMPISELTESLYSELAAEGVHHVAFYDGPRNFAVQSGGDSLCGRQSGPCPHTSAPTGPHGNGQTDAPGTQFRPT